MYSLERCCAMILEKFTGRRIINILDIGDAYVFTTEDIKTSCVPCEWPMQVNKETGEMSMLVLAEGNNFEIADKAKRIPVPNGINPPGRP